MSLKDLLGLFDGKKQSDGLNVSLEQGSKFNSIQSRIEASVIPQLSIIEQTPGLGSVIENFSGNSPEAPLGQVNSAEYKEMTALENDFNKAVSTYSQKQNALMVPRDAVIKRFGQNVIFLNVDGIAQMMPVQILGYTKENVAIMSKGLKEGASVVVKGNERIFPKQAIKSLNK